MQMRRNKYEAYVPAPDDWHGHFRDHPILELVAMWIAIQFRRVVAMGNVPPILTVEDAISYSDRCNAVTKPHGCTTLVSPKITRKTTPDLVRAFYVAGFRHLKLYLEGTTTAAEDGVSNIYELFPVFAVMQELNMVLQFHAELPGTWEWVDTSQREAMCLPFVYLIHQNFPKLRIVIEHASCAQTMAFVEDMPPDTIAATVAVQHLWDTANDVRGGLVYPERVWKPETKTWADREALRAAVLWKKLPNVFSGNDWAPHDESKKGPGPISSGGFNAPGLVPRLFELFIQHSDIHRFAAFTSYNGADFYQVPRNEDFLHLVHRQWEVPRMEGNIRVYRGGEILQWNVAGFVN